jgi:hypothetical protein
MALDPADGECSTSGMTSNSTIEQVLKTEALLKGETERVMAAHFVTTQTSWVEGHLGLLCILRSIFGNDLDKVIILAVIGQRLLDRETQAAGSGEEIAQNEIAINKPGLINIESVANSTGIPRESVRRKVGELARAGWIERLDDGGLTILPKAVDRLLPASLHTTLFLDRLIARYIGLMVADGRIAPVAASVTAPD